jgi:hypothetical protein
MIAEGAPGIRCEVGRPIRMDDCKTPYCRSASFFESPRRYAPRNPAASYAGIAWVSLSRL